MSQKAQQCPEVSNFIQILFFHQLTAVNCLRRLNSWEMSFFPNLSKSENSKKALILQFMIYTILCHHLKIQSLKKNRFLKRNLLPISWWNCLKTFRWTKWLIARQFKLTFYQHKMTYKDWFVTLMKLTNKLQ
jgi:hypothetical protein